MLVGIDFDNTLVCYDDLFHRAAVERGLLSAEERRAKQAVRDELRRTGREPQWTELQGYVYGDLIRRASAFPGAADFLAAAQRQGVGVCIISHKTRRPYQGSEYDLRQAALDWLWSQGLVSEEGGLALKQVFFEETLARKLQRIADQGCTHFIDDLPELFAEPEFPAGVRKILFTAGGGAAPHGEVDFAGDWRAIAAHLWGGDAA